MTGAAALLLAWLAAGDGVVASAAGRAPVHLAPVRLAPVRLARGSVADPDRGAQDVRAARDAYDRALALEAEGNHAAALSLLWAAAGADPRNADVQARLGEALERIGALDAAVDAYEHALGSRPDFARVMNRLVMALAQAGRGPDAVRRAEAWAAARPDDPERLFTLGLAQSEQDVEAALRTLRQVVTRRPDHALAHYNLALVLKRVDRIDDAIAAAQRAIALDGRAEAHLALATLRAHRGDLAGAVASVEAALRVDRRAYEGWLLLASVRRARGELRPAADALRRAIEVRPEGWRAHTTLAAVLAATGDDAGARRASEIGERLRDREQRERAAVVMTAVGIARFDGGDFEAARERFAAATVADDGYAPAHYNLGRALHELGREAEARRAFARAHQLNPSLVPPQSPR